MANLGVQCNLVTKLVVIATRCFKYIKPCPYIYHQLFEKHNQHDNMSCRCRSLVESIDRAEIILVINKI